jgi:hypothetical protein
MLQRNLLYTGITRSKLLVNLVGQKKVTAIAGRNGSTTLVETRRVASARSSLATSMRRKRDEARQQRSKTAIRHILSLRRG